jgi:cell division protein FtsL
MRNATLMLLAAVVISAIAVVYIRHQHRLTFITLKDAQVQRDQLNIEWRQLLLEESTWSVHHLVEKNAREKLGMITPSPNDMMMLSGRSQ